MTITHDNTLTNKQKDMDKFDLMPQTIVKASVIEELKRLQLEIDRANEEREFWTWEKIEGKCNDKVFLENNTPLLNVIEKNTARIAEIILNEL